MTNLIKDIFNAARKRTIRIKSYSRKENETIRDTYHAVQSNIRQSEKNDI